MPYTKSSGCLHPLLGITFSLLLLFLSACAGPSDTGTNISDANSPEQFTALQSRPNIGIPSPQDLESIVLSTNLSPWREAYRGNGVKIAVLDQHFGGLNRFEAQNDIQVALHKPSNRIEYNDDQIKHGTHILEIIHHLAPGAELYACRYQTYDEFITCNDWIITNDVQIVNHSAGVPAIPLDGQGEWAREVNRVAQAGILWVNAAGNFADGYHKDTFTDTNLNTYHEFRGSVGLDEVLEAAAILDTNGSIILSWEGSNTVDASAIDLGLYIVDNQGTVTHSSDRPQNGNYGDTPIEQVRIDMNNEFGVQIRASDPEAIDSAINFVLFIDFSTIIERGTAQGSIITPGDSTNALTVGAQQGNRIAPYSSRGPTQTGITKPDLTAPGELVLPDGSRFFGTSAAAPIVASSAALLWEAYPDWTQRDIRNFLIHEATQEDNEFPGTDVNYGYGRLFMPMPEDRTQSLPLPTAEPLEMPSPTQTTNPTTASSPTPSSTITHTLEPLTVTINVPEANLRNGPGLEYERVGSTNTGSSFPLLARAGSGDTLWYLILHPTLGPVWVWYDLVDLSNPSGIIETAATIPPVPTSSPTPADPDGDGIGASFDACPNEGDRGFGVQANGCPVIPPTATPQPYIPTDTDGDGIPDASDACPYQGDSGYGLRTNGCPQPTPQPAPAVVDTDNDGFVDSEDTCPVHGDRGLGLQSNGCPNIDMTAPRFDYPVDGQIVDHGFQYLFRVHPVANADYYLWGFFQNGNYVHEATTGNEYGLFPGSAEHGILDPGPLEIWVRANVGTQWTEAVVITIQLE